MKMSFECDDEELNQIFSLMNLDIPVTVDGKNISMDMSMDMMGYTIGNNVTVVDMVVYYNMNMMGQSIKMKSTMSEEQYQEFMAENTHEMKLAPDDFAKLTVESKDGKKYIVCDGITEKGLEELNGMVADSLDGIAGEANFNKVAYNVTLNDGKYESVNMTCDYSVTVDGETFNVTMKLSTEYSYDNVAEITAPSDADQYEDVSYSDLVG